MVILTREMFSADPAMSYSSICDFGFSNGHAGDDGPDPLSGRLAVAIVFDLEYAASAPDSAGFTTVLSSSAVIPKV